jgi:hypothetical protein
MHNIFLIVIVFIIILLIIYLLINKETFEQNNTNKLLLFTSAGDNTQFYDNWCSDNRNYDIWLVYYGDNEDNYNKYSKYVNRIWKRKGTKFQNLYYIYNQNYNELMKYNRFYISDDDIIINTDNINKLFNISIEYDLWICQSSYTPESKISHDITARSENNILRYSNFIEVGVPIFSKDALKKFMKYYDPKLVEWGVDFLFIWANGKDIDNKYAIIDSISCTNPHDNQKNYKKREIDNIAEHKDAPSIWNKYASEIGCPSYWELIIHSSIDKNDLS